MDDEDAQRARGPAWPALLFVELAQADPDTDVTLEKTGFLMTLNNHNIRYGDFADGDQAMQIGRAICIAMDKNGTDPMTMAGLCSSSTTSSKRIRNTFVGAAVRSFCPWDRAASA